MNKKAKFIDLGTVDYKEAWDYQADVFNKVLAVKAENRTRPEDQQLKTDNFVLFCEHPHVFTLGKSGNADHMLIPKDVLDRIGATFYHINRGGDITYHGPGQLVGYPILDLENFFTDIHKYMRALEEAVILALSEYSLEAARIPGLTGVWIDADSPQARKICALGVKTSRWVTMHGFALNVNPDLGYFDHIVPCGINDKAVTSMEKELGKKIPMPEVAAVLKEKFAEQFGIEWL